jgi:hypothetical protein
MKNIILGLLLVGSGLSANNQFEINVNSDTLELSGDLYLNDSYDVSGEADYYAVIGYLNDESGKKSKRMFVAGLKLLSPFVNESGLSFGLGIKAVSADDTSSESFLATPLSVYANYEYNHLLHLSAEYGYASKTLSFVDAKGYRDTKLVLNYKLIENGYIFAGTRSIETSYSDTSDVKYDKSMFFGYKVRF